MTTAKLYPARQAGWEIALVETLALHQAEKFAWGKSDCITRVSDLALAMTAVDPMGDMRGAYSDAAGAAGALKDLGFEDIEAALAAHFEPVAPSEARRGDCGIVLTHEGRRTVKAAVIVMGDMVMGCALPSAGGDEASGVIWLPRDQLVKAFRIG